MTARSRRTSASAETAPRVRPGDFFDGWPEGETRDVTLYVAFTRGTSSAAIDAAVADVALGHAAVELLVENRYDEDACAAGGTDPLCAGPKPNRFLGKATLTTSYEDGRPTHMARLAYKEIGAARAGALP